MTTECAASPQEIIWRRLQERFGDDAPAVLDVQWGAWHFGGGWLLAYVGGRRYGSGGMVKASEAAESLAKEAIDWEMSNPPKTLRAAKYLRVRLAQAANRFAVERGQGLLALERIEKVWTSTRVTKDDWLKRADVRRLTDYLMYDLPERDAALIGIDKALAWRLLELDAKEEGD